MLLGTLDESLSGKILTGKGIMAARRWYNSINHMDKDVSPNGYQKNDKIIYKYFEEKYGKIKRKPWL